MKQSLLYSSPDNVEEIAATEMKNAHKKRLPDILKSRGIAKVTRYGKAEYYVVSPEIFEKLNFREAGLQVSSLSELRARYRNKIKDMQNGTTAGAFRSLASSSSDELNASIKVGSGH